MLSSNNGSFFITSATSGVAFQMAKAFVREGYELVLVAEEEADLKTISKKFSPNFHVEVYGAGESFPDPDIKVKSLTKPNPDLWETESMFQSNSCQLYGPFHNKELQEQLNAIYSNSYLHAIYLVVRSPAASLVS